MTEHFPTYAHKLRRSLRNTRLSSVSSDGIRTFTVTIGDQLRAARALQATYPWRDEYVRRHALGLVKEIDHALSAKDSLERAISSYIDLLSLIRDDV